MASKRYVGIKEEASFGTEAAAPMTYDLIDGVASMGLDAPDDPNIPLPTLGRFQGKHVPGFYSPAGSLEYTLDIHTIGWFLKWALGGYEFTAGVDDAPNTHEFWAQEGYALKSSTIRVGKDTFEHVFLGSVFNKLDLSIENELLTMKADILSQKDAKAALRGTLTEIDPDLFPIAFYNAQTKVGGTDISSIVASFGFAHDNGIKPEDGQGQNSRFPYLFRAGAGSEEISIKKKYDEGSAELEAFWANATGPSNNPHTPFAVEEIFQSGDFGSMTFKFPSCYYKKVPTDIKGADPRQPELGIMPESGNITLADGTTIVRSPVLVTLQNFEDEYVLV